MNVDLGRVAFVHGGTGGQPEGIGRYAEAIGHRLADRGGTREVPSVVEVDLPGLGPTGGYISRWLRQRLGGASADVVHAANFYQVSRSTDVLTVHDLEVIENTETEYGRMPWLWGWALDRVDDLDAVVTPSRQTARRVVESPEVEPERVEVVPHGVDTETFFPEPRRHVEGLGDLPRPWFLLVGACRPRKRFLEAVRGASSIPGTVLRVGPEGERARVRKRRALLADAARDTAWAYRDLGYVDLPRLRVLLSSADLVVHPARNEGFGFVPLEAAACGTPTAVAPGVDVFGETLGSRRVDMRPRWGEMAREGRKLSAKRLRKVAEGHSWEESFRRHAALWGDVLADKRPEG